MIRFSNLILFVCSLFITGCTHLLYPADRFPYYDQTKLRPRPTEALVSVDTFFDQEGSSQKSLFTDNTGQLNTWYFPSQVPQRKGVVLHFHGNGQNLTTHFLFFVWVVNNGYDYMIFDYRGYGDSSDTEATPEKTVHDGMTMLKYVKERFPDMPIIAIGQSLGSNVLVRSLQELNSRPHLKKYLPQMVLLDSSFLSYKEATSSVLSQRWFLYPLKPLAYLAMDDDWAASEKTNQTPPLPALYFHGDKDKTVNFDLGHENYEKWPGPKVFVTLPDGGHTAAFGDQRFFKDSRLNFLRCTDAAIEKMTAFESCTKNELASQE